jgi:hypothetical protein
VVRTTSPELIAGGHAGFLDKKPDCPKRQPTYFNTDGLRRTISGQIAPSIVIIKEAKDLLKVSPWATLTEETNS